MSGASRSYASCHVGTELVSYGDRAHKGVDLAREIHGEMKRRWI